MLFAGASSRARGRSAMRSSASSGRATSGLPTTDEGALRPSRVAELGASAAVAQPHEQADEATDRLGGGAFYGDESLRSYLLKRAERAISRGEVVRARMPFWNSDSGTVSCVLACSPHVQVFARVCGFPAELAYCLELAEPRDRHQLQALFRCLPAGVQTHTTTPQFMSLLLADGFVSWPELLGPQAEALRQEWLKVAADAAQGDQTASRDDWRRLARAASGLKSSDQMRFAQDHFARMLLMLCPLSAARR